jgi:hypothetical protein|tara:strand:+ start:37 stop:831 length:795 start_codon:yes stop_codon:yes gene_type:complete
MKDNDLNEIHRHHIVPRYWCKELGIDPDFDDNLIDITRLIHAEIHWGYYCSDLSPLLEVCNPPQYVLNMIPLGNWKDTSSAVILALNEIDKIVPLSGKDHPSYGKTQKEIFGKQDFSGKNNGNYKHGLTYDREYINKRANIYRTKNKDKINARNRERYDPVERALKRPKRTPEQIEASKKSYHENKEIINTERRERYDPVKRKERYERNREQACKKSRERYDLIKKSAHYQLNREKIRARQAEYYKKNREGWNSGKAKTLDNFL